MTFNVRCWKRWLAVLAIATRGLSGCATAGVEAGGAAACPPVVEFQAWAAEELAMLPKDSAVAEMLSDYAVMREKARRGGHGHCVRYVRASSTDRCSGGPLAGRAWYGFFAADEPPFCAAGLVGRR
jgi:hypothetical protein